MASGAQFHSNNLFISLDSVIILVLPKEPQSRSNYQFGLLLKFDCTNQNNLVDQFSLNHQFGLGCCSIFLETTESILLLCFSVVILWLIIVKKKTFCSCVYQLTRHIDTLTFYLPNPHNFCLVDCCWHMLIQLILPLVGYCPTLVAHASTANISSALLCPGATVLAQSC